MVPVHDVVAWFAAFVPYSMPAYFALLGVTFLVRQVLLKTLGESSEKKPDPGPSLVPRSVEFAHNIFLSLQSVILMGVTVLIYWDTQRLVRENQLKGEFLTGSESSSESPSQLSSLLSFGGFTTDMHIRVTSRYFDLVLLCFLVNKAYEALDTVLLILNGKSLLLLHVWHHSTTFAAFYTGMFTGASYWIGVMNSFIHVIMYLYYARVSWIKPLAKYITTLQIIHLFGGTVLNFVTWWNPGPLPVSGLKSYDLTADVRRYSLLNLFLCFSYFFLFLAFFSRKYQSRGGESKRPASIWTLLRVYKLPFGKEVEAAAEGAAEKLGIRAYLGAQGLLADCSSSKEE